MEESPDQFTEPNDVPNELLDCYEHDSQVVRAAWVGLAVQACLAIAIAGI